MEKMSQPPGKKTPAQATPDSSPHSTENPESIRPTLRPEEEHVGSIWKHPYMIYIVLTVVLFILLLVIAWIAYSGGWIPSRGSNS